MRKAAIIGVALAAVVGSSTIVRTPALATEASGRQHEIDMARHESSKRDPEFNSYRFIYGVPPYDGGVAPWKRSQAKQASQDSEFDPYWFVYGVPPYDGVTQSVRHQTK